jgi:hypothetical protein
VAGPAVNVRVEGQNATLLPRTPVTLTDAPEPNTGCPSNSASNAIEIATAGNWDRQPFITTILGETHDFSNNDYWNLWVFRGGAFKVGTGACDERLATGEELLVAFQVSGPAPDFSPTQYPLWVTGVPSTVKPGQSLPVSVHRAACETASCLPGEGHEVPAAGATVTAGGRTYTTGVDGVATVTFDTRGPVSVRAAQTNAIPSATASSCVTDGADGFCGYEIPTPPPGPGPAPAADITAPATTITGLRKRYKRGKGPRTLGATIDDGAGSGVGDVKLAITRVRDRKCAGFGNDKGRFRKIKCGRRLLFSVGPRNVVSFLLPARLGRGRYTFNVIADDKAGNRQEQFFTFRVK